MRSLWRFAAVLAPAMATLGTAFFIVLPWMTRIDLGDPWVSRLAHASAGMWLLVLWIALHQLWFQFWGGLVGEGRECSRIRDRAVRFVLVYTTCDDFRSDSLTSCCRQDYPAAFYRVIVGDDGTDPDVRRTLKTAIALLGRVTYLPRSVRLHFKAGNLNNVLDALEDGEEWLVLVDADQILPTDYLRKMADAVADLPASVAFVQGGHVSDDHIRPMAPDRTDALQSASSAFQAAMGLDVAVFYQRELPWREQVGFLPMLGHGVAIRRSSLIAVGGFPRVVSEDYALSMEFRNAGFRGHFCKRVSSWEAFPETYDQFAVRLKKFSGGTGQLLRTCVARFLKGPAHPSEKLDLLILLGNFFLMPILIVNGFVSCFVCGRLWAWHVSMLHPVLPYVFVGMFILTMSVLCGVARSLSTGIRFWFWAMAVYMSCVPVGAVRFLAACVGWEPGFVPTGGSKGRQGLSLMETLGTIGIGVLASIAAWTWVSPFSLVLTAQSISWVSTPVYKFLHRRSASGVIARAVVPLPGLAWLASLYAMWFWGYRYRY